MKTLSDDPARPTETVPHRPLGAGLRGCRGVVFDTDGVLLDSAGLHAAAWKEAFDAVLRERGPSDQEQLFDVGDDYRRHVDGKSRLDGAAAFLAARGLDLPVGEPDDPPGTGTVRAVAARKDELFTALLRQRDIPPLPGVLPLLTALRAADIPCAVISASRHAAELLDRAGLRRDLFQALVDGHEAARLGLPGKPDPAVFTEAARRLGTPAGQTAVVEDAQAGVAAGRRGGFTPVIGVDRSADGTGAAELRRHGAHWVVRDLSELLDRGE